MSVTEASCPTSFPVKTYEPKALQLRNRVCQAAALCLRRALPCVLGCYGIKLAHLREELPDLLSSCLLCAQQRITNSLCLLRI